MTPEERERLLASPALDPPPGVVPNFVNPHGPRNLDKAIIALIISSIVVLMRLFVKWRSIRRLHLDDYCLLIAWIVYGAGYDAVVFLPEKPTFGAHQWDMTVKQASRQLYLLHICVITYFIVTLFLKAAISLQCLRIFVPTASRNITYWVLHGLFWANNVVYVLAIFLKTLGCRPISKIWDMTIQDGKCINQRFFYVFIAVFSVISDFMLVAMAQQVIWGLITMKLRMKLCLSGVFIVGLGACACAGARVHDSLLLYTTEDITFRTYTVGKWATLEFLCGFLAAGLPFLPKFAKILGEQPAFSRLITVVYRITGSQSSRVSPVASDGKKGGNPSTSENKKKQIITDVEFQSLVVNTRATDTRSSLHDDLEAGGPGSREGTVVVRDI